MVLIVFDSVWWPNTVWWDEIYSERLREYERAYPRHYVSSSDSVLQLRFMFVVSFFCHARAQSVFCLIVFKCRLNVRVGIFSPKMLFFECYDHTCSLMLIINISSIKFLLQSGVLFFVFVFFASYDKISNYTLT